MSFKDSGLGSQAEVIRELLDDQMEQVSSKIFKFLFDDAADIEILLHYLSGTLDKQTRLLINFQENEGIPQSKPDDLAPEIWALLITKNDLSTHSFLLARIQILLSILLACEARKCLDNHFLPGALESYGQSSMMLGCAMSSNAAYWLKDSVSSYARKAVTAKLAADPKQKDKVLVRARWDEWQTRPNQYKSKAAFSLDMLKSFKNLENQAVIEGWCRTWERES